VHVVKFLERDLIDELAFFSLAMKGALAHD
jgi:hypothetical protein